MGEAMVTAAGGAINSLIRKLDRLLDGERMFMKSELESMRACLMDLSASVEADKQQRDWMEKLRELSYDMEDSVDELIHRLDRESASKLLGTKGTIDGCVDLPTKTKIRSDIAKAMEGFKSVVLGMSERRQRYWLHDCIGPVASNSTVDPRLPTPYAEVPELIGADGPRDELIKFLTNGEGELVAQLKVLSIVGFGGVGKTALASEVYRRLQGQFESQAFVSVSQRPDMKRILRGILHQISRQMHADHDDMDEVYLISQIRELLKNRRYFIVVDDLWDTEAWEIIKCALPENNSGSRVVATTRIYFIAKTCCSGSEDLIYEIKPLSDFNAEKLLKRILHTEGSFPDGLTKVPDQILKMCGGMPLAITSIASLLAKKVSTKESWEELMSSLDFSPKNIPALEASTKILSLSCSDLPCNLEACMLYLSIFPEDHKIERDSLVRKWIAEGFIPEETGRGLEEVANEYLDELINRNVVHSVKYGNGLGEDTNEVHSMMLYHLRDISQKGNFVTIWSDLDVSGSYRCVRRLSIQCSDSKLLFWTERTDLSCARSLTICSHAKPVSFEHFKRLRVLDLEECEDLENADLDAICRIVLLKYLSLKKTRVTELPPEIGNLQYLETLDVREAQIVNLPAQIGELQNLVTLDVRKTRVRELPEEVVQLSKLVHLLFGSSSSFGGTKLPQGGKHLRSLRVLRTIDLRECSATVVQGLGELTELRELAVASYDGRADMKQNDNLLSSIGKCTNLQSLTIYGDFISSPELPAFPKHLRKLIVAGRCVNVPGWIEQLSVLSALDIRVLELGENDMKILRDMCCLRSLHLALLGLPRKQILISSEGFASLEVFTFDCRVPWVTFEKGAMPNLKHFQLKLYAGSSKIPSGIMRLQSLKKVILQYSLQYASSDIITETIAVMREEAGSHANLIVLSINGEQEIFPWNTSAEGRTTGIEIEE